MVTKDPVSQDKVYIVSQMDVTEISVAERQLQKANEDLRRTLELLAREKERTDTLLRRQVSQC